MAKVPVLNDNQFERLKNVLGERKVIDLTDKPSAHSSRLPTMLPEEKTDVVADGTIIIKVKNNTGSTLQAGKVVAIDISTPKTNDVFPIKSTVGTSSDDFNGIVMEAIENDASGKCLVFGLASVSFSGSAGKFLKPNSQR